MKKTLRRSLMLLSFILSMLGYKAYAAPCDSGIITGTASACVGGTTLLSETVSTGTWSTDDPTIATVDATGNVTGVSEGIVHIYYTIGSGCADSAVDTVTINALPTVAAIGGTPSVCVGSTTALTDTTGSGTWSSDDATVASVDASGNVTGVAGGTVNILYTVTNSSGCSDSAVVTVTVNTLPVMDTTIASATEICIDGTATLTNTTTGSGTWSSDDGAIATVDGAGLVTSVSAGTVNILYTVTTLSGCTDSAVTAITVDSIPVVAPIVGMPGICFGSTNAFSDVTLGGTWSSDDATIASVDASGNVTGVATGSVNIRYTVTTGGGCSDSSVISVTVNPLPVVDTITGATTVCAASVTTLSDTTTGGVWDTDDPTIATVDASGNVTGVSGGPVNIKYIVTNSFSCTDSAVTTVTINPLIALTAIVGTPDVCILSTTAFTETATGGTWSSDDATIASVDASGNVSGIAAGTVNILYTATTALGCTDSVVMAVTVHPLPVVTAIIGSSTVCALSTTMFTDATAGGIWSRDDGTIVSMDYDGNLLGVSAGTTNIAYTVTTAFGCTDSAVKAITVYPVPVVDTIAGSTSVCLGSTITLSDDTTGGVWSSFYPSVATVDAYGNVTGLSTTGFTIIIYAVTNSFGCTDSVFSSLEIEPLPIIAPIDGTPSVCVLSTTLLTETTPFGTWSSDDSTIASVDSFGIVTGVSAGSVNIVYTGTNSAGCTDTASVTFTVNPLPVVDVITGTTNVCQAAVTSLTDDTLGGIWSSDDNTIASVDAFGNVTGITTGTVTIVYTVTSPFGCTDSATTVVTVLTSPPSVITVVGDTLLCPGGSVEFDANTDIGLTYQWYDDDGTGSGSIAISGATTSSYVADTTGLYTVLVTNGIGCSTLSSGVNAISSPSTAIISAAGPTTICELDDVLLSANVGTGLTYQWQVDGSPIFGATDATYGASTTGDYAVVVTNSAGCSATSTITTVTVNPLPVVADIDGSASICAGSMETLSDITDGGTWSSEIPSIASIDPATGVLTAVSAGTVNILYTVTSTLGCSNSSIFPVTVTALPTTTITTSGVTTFCVGGSVVLSANYGVGFTYQWLFNGSPIVGETSISYTADSTGLYSVIVTSGTCFATSAATQVIAVPTPVLTPDNPVSFCWGSSVAISTGLGAIPVSGAVYQWQRNGFDITGATGATYTAYLGGDYTCNVTISGSCLTTSDTIHVTLFPLPNPVITYTGITLGVANIYVTYQWYKNLVPVTGAITNQLTTTDDGHYTVAVTDSNGCQNVSDEYIIDLLGVHNVTAGEINIYPNPATAIVHITSPVRLRAVISTVEGKVAMTVENAKDINVHELPDGVYLIMLYDDNGRQVKVQKLIKTAN